MVCGLEPGVFVTVLVRSMAGEDSRDVENYGRLLIREGVLRGWFMCKCVKPDMSLAWA